jgi:hypothetical protein
MGRQVMAAAFDAPGRWADWERPPFSPSAKPLPCCTQRDALAETTMAEGGQKAAAQITEGKDAPYGGNFHVRR